VTQSANPRNLSRDFFEQWDELSSLLINSSSLALFGVGKTMNPDARWNSQPIHTIVGPSSHFFHDIGSRSSMHRMAITEALKPMIDVS